jgi:flagellar assembly protein FliH
MPSLPEPQVWQPTDLAAAPLPVSRSRPHRLFEVTRPAETPDEVLAPARAAAEARGYAAGWAKGLQASRAVAHAEHEAALRTTETRAAALLQALTAVGSAAHRLEDRTAPALEQVEGLVLTLAFDLAEAIVGARLRDDEKRGIDALNRALAAAPNGEPVRLHLHPADVQALRSADLPPGVELVADPTQTPGDAVANCGATEIDARITTAVERVRQQLEAGR